MSCIITHKGQKYSEEQFKEYFINNKQEFATSIAKNKYVIDSFKRKMEAIDVNLYSQYLKQNPNGTVEGFKEFVQGKQFQKLTAEEKAKTIERITREQNNSLFGLNTQNQEQLEFHINTLNVVSKFLENVGVEQRLVSEFLSQDGSIIDGALAAANFIEGTVDIIDDLDKGRAEAWNKLPEEAAHWWYRLLDKNSELKDALLTSALTDRKEEELRNSLYGKTYEGVKVVGKLALDSKGNITSKPALSAIREEAIGQLIAEAIKRIETKNGSAADYSFFKKFLEWINSIIDIFKNTEQDPFEVAAMKILSSDMSDLMTWEEYRKLNNIVNFADVLTEQSVAPIDYTLIEDIGKVEKINEVVGFKDNGDRIVKEKLLWVGKDSRVGGGLTFGKTSPSFFTQQELDNWVSANIKEHDIRQKQLVAEVRDNQIFFDRLLNKTFRKKSKFLPKTLRKYFDIIDAQNLNPLREWNISQELQQITKKLSEQEKKQIIETNGYTNIAPTLKVLPDLLQKYRKNPIVLSEPIKVDGAKKQEISILNGIKEMIKLENPNLKSITAEEFVNEAHNWLQTNYLLGFANEKSYLSYRTDQTFSYLSDRQSNEDVDITNMTEEELQRLPFEERQRIANIVGLTKQNPDVYHNKVSLRFNDSYHADYGQDANHFAKRPSAWGNLTYFYTGKNKWKDAVLLHEIQNDNIEALRNFKTEKVDLETSLGRYLQQLNTDLLDNITQIESGGKKIIKNNVWSTNPPKQHLQLNYQLEQLKNLPLEQGLQQLKQRLNELIELHKSDTSKDINKAQEAIDKAYSQRRIFQDFQKRGGIKSLLKKEELQDLEDILKRLNTEEVEGEAQWLPEENQFEPGFPSIRDLKQKKQDFNAKTIELQARITRELQKMYGDNAPLINLTAPAKPLPKSQRRNQIVNRGTPRERRIGNASQELNENVNFLIAFSEQQIIKQLSKNIEESKKNYIQARNATNAYNFNVKLAKITQEQYNNLIENYKYNQDLLNRLIDEQAQKDIQKESNIQNKITEAYQSIENRDYYYEYFLDGKRFEVDTREEAEKDIEDYYNPEVKKRRQHKEFEALKQKALEKKAELEKNYGKIEEEVKQTLEIEMNYFTPLVHHLIQKHINQYGKDFPMYFSGYNITKLTQGNDRTALIYAGKDEVNIVDKNAFEFNEKKYQKLGQGAVINAGTKEELRYFKLYDEYKVEDKDEIRNVTEQEFNKAIQEYEKAYQQATERRAKEIKFRAAKEIGLLNYSDFNVGMGYDYELQKLTDKELEEGIKKLNEYKKQSKQNLDRVVNTIMNISNNKPIETGAIYNAMSQISGVKLIWQDKIDGLKGNAGGYLVDLSNYNYNTPILYGLDTSKVVPINPTMVDNSEIQYSKISSQETQNPNNVNYQLKAIGILNSEKGKQVFEKGQNNKKDIKYVSQSTVIIKETEKVKSSFELSDILWEDLLTVETKQKLKKLKLKINNLTITYNTNEQNHFDNETNTINLNIYEAQALANLSNLSLDNIVNIIILHEHTHAAFEYAIENNPDLKSKLITLHELFLNSTIKYNFNDVLRNNLGLGDLYQKDLYEFIADAFSNPDVINVLKQIKIENENLTFYDKFISFIKNILSKIGIDVKNTAFDEMQKLFDSFTIEDNILTNWQDFDFEVRGITSFGETTEVKSYDTYKQFNNKLNNIFNKFKDNIINNNQSKEVKELLEERKNILSEFKDYFTDIDENKEISETVSEDLIKKAEIAFEKNINYFLSIADYKITKINALKEKYERLKNEDNKIEYSNTLAKLKEEFKFFNNSIIDLNLLITIQKQTIDQKSKNDLTSLITSINSIHNFEKEINKDIAIHEASNTILSETNKKALDKANEDIIRIEEKIKNESNENVKKRLEIGLKIAKNKLDLINQEIRIQNEFGNLKNKKTDTSVFSKLFESASMNSQVAVAVVQDILLQTKMSISQAQLNLSNQFQKIYDDYLKEFNIKINDVKSQIWMKQQIDELIKDENGKIIFNEDGTPKTIKVDYILHDISKEFYDELNKLEVKKALIERQYKGADENKKILLNKQLADVSKELYNFKKDYIKGEYTTEYWNRLNEIDNLKSNEGIPLKDIIRDNFDDFQNKKRDLNKRLKSGSKNFNEKIFDEYYSIKENEKKFNDWLNEDKNKELKLKYTSYKNNIKDIFEKPDSNENKILAETYIKNVKQKLINDGKSKNEIDKILLKLKHTLYVFTDSDEHLTNIKTINNDIDLIKLKLSLLQSNKNLERYKNRIDKIINTKVLDIYNILNQFRLADGTIDIDKFNSLENVDEIKKEYINNEFHSDLNNLLYELNNIDNLTNDETELLHNLEELKKLKSSKNDLFEYQESEYYNRDFENGTLVEGIDFRYFGEEKIISPWYSIRTAKESTQSLNPIYFGESKINQNYINKDYDKDIIKFTDNAKIRFRNNSYYSISNRQKTLLDNLTNRYFDAQKRAKKKNGYRLPSIAKSTIDRLLGKEFSANSIKTGIKEFAFNSINLVDELTGVTDHNFEFYRIPTKYSSQIESNENADNVIMSLYIYSMATLEENAFRESYSKVDAIRKSIDPQAQKNTLEQVVNIINTYWFGNKEVAKSSTEKIINRIVDHLLSFASFKTFALNIPGQAVNFSNAKITTYIQKNENRFSLSNWKYGEQIATIAIKNEFKDEFKAGETSFYNQFAQYMGLKEIRQRSIESKGLKKWNLKLLSWLKNITEANIFYSLLFTYSDKITLNVDGKEIRFHELFEIKTDINGFQFFQIKKEYQKYENKIQTLKTQFVKEFRDSYRVINGNFMNLEETELNRVWYGRLAQFMRKHITPMMVDRFQSKGRYNHYTGDIQQGFYIIFAKALINDFKAFHFNIMMYGQSWSADEKLAAMKVLKEFSAIMSITGLLFIFGYGDDYDPEDEEEFLNSKWFLNHWIYVMLKTQSEIKSFNPIMGTKELLETFDNTTVATSSLKDWRKLIDYTRLWIINDEDAYFKQDSGWWEEGDPKMQKYLYKQVGITGSFENSSQNLKNFEFGQRFR